MSLEEMLIEGITIFGLTSLKMVDGELVKVEQISRYEFPLSFMWEGKPVTVIWDADIDELVIFDTVCGEIDQSGLYEILNT